MTKIAVIRVRGQIGIRDDINRTLDELKLFRKNFCCVVDEKMLGHVKKIKDYVTYGEIDDATFKELVAKRGEEYKGRLTDSKEKIKYNKYVEIDGKKYKKFFRLHPPLKGFERKGTKKPFSLGGALGYRGAKINDLIKRMI